MIKYDNLDLLVEEVGETENKEALVLEGEDNHRFLQLRKRKHLKQILNSRHINTNNRRRRSSFQILRRNT